MSNNVLLTGPPGSGKSTVVRRVVEQLWAGGDVPGGVVCPERTEDGRRVGFDIEDVMSGEVRDLASVDRSSGPVVGNYRVNLAGLEGIVEAAFPRAMAEGDVVIIDEIAPMEIESVAFREAVRAALDSPIPTLATIHSRSTEGFIGAVKSRSDVEIVEVTGPNRDDLPERLVEMLLSEEK